VVVFWEMFLSINPQSYL